MGPLIVFCGRIGQLNVAVLAAALAFRPAQAGPLTPPTDASTVAPFKDIIPAANNARSNVTFGELHVDAAQVDTLFLVTIPGGPPQDGERLCWDPIHTLTSTSHHTWLTIVETQ